MRVQKSFPFFLILCALLSIPFAFLVNASTQDAAVRPGAPDAPTGYDNMSNGFTSQTDFDTDRTSFETEETIASGLGPVFNGRSCQECHQDPVSGGASQTRGLHAGHDDGQGNFVPATVTINDGIPVSGLGPPTIAGRQFINLRAICPATDLTQVVNGVAFQFPNTAVYERLSAIDNIRSLHIALNMVGDGFVESLADATIQGFSQSECANQGVTGICGQSIEVSVLESNGGTAVGRFGWKDAGASLLSEASNAYEAEEGISNRLPPNNVDTTRYCDIVPDPNDNIPDNEGLEDIDHFARFLRALKAPPVDANISTSSQAVNGGKIFAAIGCAICHIPGMTTAPAGTAVDAGQFIVPAALGGMTIHPYSDFLLHNVGTGDGIVESGVVATAKDFRTPPLWGLRLRTELMHDGSSYTFDQAIRAHAGEAAKVIAKYEALTPAQQTSLAIFLSSL
jgi:CxxC motif-containing protein (DUF1111 family)